MKTVNVNRGDYINVVAVINGLNTSYRLDKGKLTVRWDSDYVDLVETNGKYFNSSLSYTSISKVSGKLTIGGFSSSNLISSSKANLFELKFQVLKTAGANSFKIYQMDGEDSINCVDNDNSSYECAESLYTELKYNVSKSNNNKLSAIKLDDLELEYFDGNILEYDISVEQNVDHINISAIKQDNTSVIGGDLGNKELKYGINTFRINVISESGVINTYTLNITRIDERSKINTLKTLTISDVTFKFKPNTTEYNIDVNNNVENIIIDSTLTDPKSIYVHEYGNRGVTLNEGSNKVLIKVLSESGEERVYTLNITRALSGNNTLKSLTLNDEKIYLRDKEFIYHYTVETEVDSVVIKAIPTDNKANVNIKDKYDLAIGDNQIDILVIAPDGSRASYILNINRKKVLSNNSALSNIKIIGYKINFKKDTTMYDLKIKDEEEQLDIYTVPEDTTATVKIEGNEDLKDGSIIKINVKAEDGTYTRYFINIEKNKKNPISPVIIIIIVLLILLALCIIGIIKKNKKGKIKALQELIIEEGKESGVLDTDIGIVPGDYDVNEPVEEVINGEMNKDI